ncbi:hypothetical protein Tco_1124774 [Tanacetum coccineum]|uniref:Uncharacterized protein n=1 Tax=Tanacetum coccineum TaxID=301880 RepID=A0ABQ5J7H5_9ASTR
MLRWLDQLMERTKGGGMYLLWVPLIGDIKTLMMDEAHASRYLVHSGANKTYYDLRDMYGGHYLADTNLHVHLEEIKVDKTLRFAEEPVEIIDREVKSLKRSRIPIVKSIGTRSEMACYKMMHRHSDPYDWANRSRHEQVTESPCVHDRWKPKVPRDTLPAARNYNMFDLTQMIRSYHMRVETSVRFHFSVMEGFYNHLRRTCKEPTLMELFKAVFKVEDDLTVNPPNKTKKRKTNNEEKDEQVSGRTEGSFFEPHLNKENETLKKHYKDMYDSIKLTRVKTIEQTTSLITQNANLKAQIQEKVFAIAALKSEIRKSNRNSVDTKFA